MTGDQEPYGLHSDRLDLRPLMLDDLDLLHPILSDPHNCVHMPEGPKDNLDASRKWIERFSARWSAAGLGYWTVRLRDTDGVIGLGGAERRPRFWNLYYLLDRNYWGYGYGTELALAARREAAIADPALPLVAWIHRANVASQAVARRIGLRDYGLLEPQHWKGEPMHYWADREPDRS